jgi:protein-S-isoprenylcysteine O-methyltransferase Ste14
MQPVDYVILVGWIVFWVGWIAAAFYTRSASQAQWGRGVGLRALIVIVVIALFRAGAFKGHGGLTHDAWREGVGLALFLGGLGLAVSARVYLGSNWGTPMSRKADPELVTTGPYRSIRHPIYSGIILAAVGTTVAVSLYWVAAAVMAAAYFTYSSFVEERTMQEAFPDSYPGYKRATKRFVPFVF